MNSIQTIGTTLVYIVSPHIIKSLNNSSTFSLYSCWDGAMKTAWPYSMHIPLFYSTFGRLFSAFLILLQYGFHIHRKCYSRFCSFCSATFFYVIQISCYFCHPDVVKTSTKYDGSTYFPVFCIMVSAFTLHIFVINMLYHTCFFCLSRQIYVECHVLFLLLSSITL